MKQCHKCGHEWSGEKRQPGPKEYCESCSAYLHCCLNCKYHDRNAHNQCYIPNTEWVGDRAKGNYCDEFEFKDTGAAADGGKEGDVRQAFQSLFDEDEGDSGAPKNFEDLFGC